MKTQVPEYESIPQRRHAVKWTGQNTDELIELKQHANSSAELYLEVDGPEDAPEPTGVLEVVTVDGNRVTVPVGAYVVLDMNRFPYPCAADIFEKSNRLVEY